MKSLINKIISIISSVFKSKPAPVVVKVPSQPPLPEIPTQSEVDNFPNKSTIEDFKFSDISHYEDNFDVKRYTAMKYRLLLHKTTQGKSFVDDKHAARKLLCENNGLIYGGYHFYQCYQDPIRQAQFYVETHGNFAMNPILDYEKESGKQDEKDLTAEMENAYLFMCEIERLTGKTPIFYSYVSLLNTLKMDPKWARFPLWIARYNSVLGPVPSPWSENKVFAWQYSDAAPYDGIGNCDGNIYYGKNNILKLN